MVRPLSFLNEQGIGETLQHLLAEWGITLEEWADKWSWMHGFFRGLFEELLALREQLL